MWSALSNFARYVYTKHVEPILSTYWPVVKPYYVTAKSVLLHALVLFMILLFCLYFSAFLFGVIYYYSMPTIYQSYPLDFQYNRKCIQEHRNYLKRGDGAAAAIYQESCYPVAYVNFDFIESKTVDPHQPYAVYMSLQLPESFANLEMGMFMATMKYGNKRTSQSASMQFHPFPIRAAYILVFWPLMIFDVVDSKQTINIPLSERAIFDHHLKKNAQACRRNMRLEIPHAVKDGGTEFSTLNSIPDNADPCSQRVAILLIDYPDIEIYSARLHLTATFSGLQYLLFQWPVFSFVVGTSLFFVPVLASTLVLIYLFFWLHPLGRTSNNEVAQCCENVEGGDPEHLDNEPEVYQEACGAEPNCDTTAPNHQTGLTPPTSSASTSSSSIEVIGSSTSRNNEEWDKKSDADAREDHVTGEESSFIRRRR